MSAPTSAPTSAPAHDWSWSVAPHVEGQGRRDYYECIDCFAGFIRDQDQTMSDAMQRSGILEECGGRDWSNSEVGDIATGPIVPKSAINGHGYGSCHTWTHTHTAHVAKCSHYVCSVCGTDFAHYYNQVPDIFAAMLREAVPETCVVSAKKE